MKNIIILDGYETKFWFWEAVVLLRKIVLSLVIVFVSAAPGDAGGSYPQGLSTVFVLFIASFAHAYYKPFFREKIDLVETLGLIVATVTLYLGLWYIDLDVQYTNCVAFNAAVINQHDVAQRNCNYNKMYFNTSLIFIINIGWLLYVARLYYNQEKLGHKLKTMVSRIQVTTFPWKRSAVASIDSTDDELGRTTSVVKMTVKKATPDDCHGDDDASVSPAVGISTYTKEHDDVGGVDNDKIKHADGTSELEVVNLLQNQTLGLAAATRMTEADRAAAKSKLAQQLHDKKGR